MKEKLRFNSILKILPTDIREQILQVLDYENVIQEIRIRVNNPCVIIVQNKSIKLNSNKITLMDIQTILDNATNYSLHTYMDSLKNGFITIEGGHRIGVCGTLLVSDDNVHIFKNFSSINIRIAHQIIGCADELLPKISSNKNLLLISPPAFGKTTLMRDLIRSLSKEDKKISVADERGEICGIYNGMPMFDLGENTDVLDSCPKDIGAMMLIRTMSPDILVMDEITSDNDINSAIYASNCGVSVFATAHAYDARDFYKRQLYRKLYENNLFEQAVFINMLDNKRVYNLIKLRSDENV